MKKVDIKYQNNHNHVSWLKEIQTLKELLQPNRSEDWSPTNLTEERLQTAFNKSTNQNQFEIVLAAIYAANYLSIREFENMRFENTSSHRMMIITLAVILTTNVMTELGLSENNKDWFATKYEILQEIVPDQIQGILKVTEEFENLSNQQLLLRNTPEIISGFARENLELVCCDGVVQDRPKDPPGQRSVYIPPGDTFMESYRLSTFIRFPEHSPANPRPLASAGFFYTGYKDRVKCFSCGLCVQDWNISDDVRAARWHREDCPLMKGEDCGNVEIGGGGLARFLQPTDRSQVGSRGRDLPDFVRPRNAAAASSPSLATKHRAPASHQTARPVFQSSSINSVEFATIPSSYHERFVKNMDLRKESERLRTFEHWPNETPTVSSNDLARSGFFYLGNLDRVQCFSCAGVLRNWNYGDNVQAEHRRHFPHCRLVQGNDPNNISLTPDEREQTASSQPVFTEPPDPSEAEQRDLRNMFQCQFPVNPHMRNEDVRFETFDHRWNANNVDATPRQIARAGFFFLGERDRVKCWYCNGGLQNWDPQDEPWTEHAKWFPTCEFLLQRKGPDFVHRMVSLFPNLPRPQLRGAGLDVPPMLGERRGQSEVNRPPPQIIDPQEDLRREEERVNVAMRTDVARAALDMGFELRTVRGVIRRRLRDGEMYSSVADIIDDVTAADDDVMESETEDEVATSSGSGIECAEEPMETTNNNSSPSMQSRIDELRAERMCKICRVNISDLVLVPCGHLCTCQSCHPRRCPLCNKKVEKSIRAYIT